jgi:hypothetical protein
MSRKFEVFWPDFDTVIECELLDDENPEMCDAFWRGLPFNTVMAASMSAGEMFKVPVPMALPDGAPEKRVFFPDQVPGTFLSLGWGSLLLKTGIVAEPFRLPRMARVLEKDLPALQNVATKLREAYFFTKVVNKATFRVKE